MRHFSRDVRTACLLLGLLVVAFSIPVSPSSAAPQSPDGASRIAFVTRNYDLRTMTISTADPATGSISTLVNDGYFAYPTWSPDGRQLAFIGRVREFDRETLYVMNSDGTDLRELPLRPPALRPVYVTWSPDSTRLLFAAVGFSGLDGFHIINPDGSGQERLPLEIPARDLYEAWIVYSPDGSQIAFSARVDGDYNVHLLTANADGTNAVDFPARNNTGGAFSHLIWSPDGTQVVLDMLAGDVTTTHELRIANADGSNARSLVTPPPDHGTSTSWSPDGTQVAFVAMETGDTFVPDGEVWVINADGTNLRSLNVADDVAQFGTSWALIPPDVALPAAPVSLATAG